MTTDLDNVLRISYRGIFTKSIRKEMVKKEKERQAIEIWPYNNMAIK